MAAGGNLGAFPDTFPITSLVPMAWPGLGAEDPEGQKAILRPTTQECSPKGVGANPLGAQSVYVTLTRCFPSLGLGFPIQQKAAQCFLMGCY